VRPSLKQQHRSSRHKLSDEFSLNGYYSVFPDPSQARFMMTRVWGDVMAHAILHEIFQWHGIHEILHLLSGCFGSFFGTWFYFSSIEKRKIRREGSQEPALS
jgi:hypothetical protein